MLKRNSLAFTVLLSGLVAIPPLSTDIGLPAYAATAAALQTTEATVALTLSFFMLGFAVGPLFYGPMSERFGRRPVLLAGLSLYLVASIVCTFAPSIGVLLGSRLFQGFGASAGTVLAIACIRDLFDGITALKKISYVMMINGLMPMIAPSIGVFVLAAGGWSAIYAVMTVGGLFLVLGVLFGFEESVPRKNPDALAIRQLISNYGEVLTHPISAKSALLNAACFGVLFAFISGSPILFINMMHVPSNIYGYAFAITVLGTIGGTLFNSFFAGKKGRPTRILRIGLALITLTTLAFLTISVSGHNHLIPIVALLFASNFGIGLISPHASYAAVKFLPHLAGVASAVLASAQMVIGAISAALVALLFDVLGPSALPAVMFGFAMLACALYLTTPNTPPLEPAILKRSSGDQPAHHYA
jgi:DHA1 family bicyclomycin/chloramphenicol resistance-like MFS transporter